MEALGNGLSVVGNGDILLDGRALCLGSLYLADDVGVVYAYDGLDRGTGVTVNDVVLGQHVGGRNDNGTNLAQRQHDYPPLVATFQDEHDRVVLADAQRLEVAGSLVRLFLQILERGTYLFALVISPQQSQSLGLLFCPCVHHVVGKVKVLWNDELQMFVVILHRLEMGLL